MENDQEILQIELDKLVNRQYKEYGGFCADCGNAIEPVVNENYDMLGLCECKEAKTK